MSVAAMSVAGSLIGRLSRACGSKFFGFKGARARDSYSPSRNTRSHLLRLEPLEERQLLSAAPYPEIPGMVLVDPVEDQFAGQVVYLDFDGAENVTYDGPVVVDGIDIPAFEALGELAGREAAIIDAVVAELEATFEGTGIKFTTEQPTEGTEYSTVYIGGDDSAFEEYGDFIGLSETIDIGNRDKADAALVFADEVGPLNSVSAADTLARVIEHETGHLVGMRHANEEDGGVLDDYAATESDVSAAVLSYTPKVTDDLAVYAHFSGQAEVDLAEYIIHMYSSTLTFYWDVEVRDEWDIIGSSQLTSERYYTTISRSYGGDYTITKDYSPTQSTTITVSSSSVARDMVRYLGTPSGIDSNGDGWGDGGVAYIPLNQSAFKDNCYVNVRFSSSDALFDYHSDWQTAWYRWENSAYFDILNYSDAYSNQIRGADIISSNSYSGTITPEEDVDVRGKYFNSGKQYRFIASGDSPMFQLTGGPQGLVEESLQYDFAYSGSGEAWLWDCDTSGYYYMAVWNTLGGNSYTVSVEEVSAQDTSPPTPNPSTWSTAPYATGTTSIKMYATAASDSSGVQYYFDCTTSGGHDSGWQSSRIYEDTGLSANTSYTYRVKTRDTSSNQNTGSYSASRSATTGSSGDSYETDNTSSQANSISTNGTPQTHSIHVGSDVDWVKFTLSQTADVTVETNGSSGDTGMWLYGPNSSTTEVEYDDDGGNGYFSKIVRSGSEALAPGTYYVKVDEYGNDNTIANYTISVTIDSALTHVTISGDTTPDESSTEDYTLRAYYSDGSNQVVTSSASWSENSSYATINSSGRLTTSSVSSNQPCRITASYGGESDYLDVTIQNVGSSGDSYETDNTSSQANSISTNGTPQTHSIHVGSDVDWVKFTLSQTADVTVETNGSSGDTGMWLYGPNSSTTEVEYDDDGGNGYFSKIVRSGSEALAPGTYYVKVDEYGNDNTIANYTISVTIDSALTHVTISGDTTPDESSTEDYTLRAYYSDGSNQVVTSSASWSENSPYATINSSGRLTTSSVSSNQPCRITASYGGESDYLDVTIQNVGSSGDSYEIDNASSQAKSISTNGTPQTHSIHVGSDVDWVKFTLSETADVTVETNGSSGDTRMWLYGPNSSTTLVDYDDDGGNGNFSKIVRSDSQALVPGTYYVKIDEYGNNNTIANYTITVEAEGIVTDPSLCEQALGPFNETWNGMGVNHRGQNEKYFTGANNVWYAILPSGDMYRQPRSGEAWFDSGARVASLDFIYWQDPNRLFDVNKPARANAYAFARAHGGLTEDMWPGWGYNHRGHGEKYFYSTAEAAWYAILPNGEIHHNRNGWVFNGNSLEKTASDYFWQDPNTLLLIDLPNEFKLYQHTNGQGMSYPVSGYSYNRLTRQEKYYEATDGRVFFIEPSGDVYLASNPSVLYTELTSDVWHDLSLLRKYP